MTITTNLSTTVPTSRTQAATAFADQALTERGVIAAKLQEERAAYAELLSYEGAFEDTLHAWLVNDVLPSIRATGGYLVDDAFRFSAASIVGDDTGLLMLPILADISEHGLGSIRMQDAVAETFANLDL